MTHFIRLATMLILVMGLLAMSGCGKDKTGTGTEGFDDDGIKAAESLSAAERAIIDSVAYFNYDQYILRDDAKANLQRVASLMKEQQNIRILIEGHCDARGTIEYNLALGERRARAVADYLMMLGIENTRIETISRGKEYPAVDGTGEAAWSKNRRGEFKIIR